MASDYLMKQCMLQRYNVRMTSWIPCKYAVKGKFLRLKDVDGWEVVAVFGNCISASYQSERSRDYLCTRKASDI